MYYRIRITQTGKTPRKEEDFRTFNFEEVICKTLEEVKKELKDRYGEVKQRTKMYRDVKDGEPVHSGYVYHYRNSDMSHYPVNEWIQEDWVEVAECTEKLIVVGRF